MKLDDLLNKYIVIEKRDGKYVRGILVEIIRSNEIEENFAYTTLIIRVDDNKYKNVHLIEVENIGEIV